MCGGRGSRLDTAREKPLVPVAGRPMIDRVGAALESSRVATVHAAVSPETPATRDHLAGTGVCVLETPGAGYVADLSVALEQVGRPALTVAADLPLLTGAAVDRVLGAADGSLAVAVPVDLKRRLGVSVDAASTFEHAGARLIPTGCNVVAETDDDIYVSDDPRLAVNVNHRSDLQVAEALS